jgi:hypothetical protein
MEHHERIIELLTRIEQNQQRALQAQQEALQAQQQHLQLAQAQFERTHRDIDRSFELQRVSVARQTQIRNVAMPLIGVLVLLLIYLLIKSRILL